MYTSILNRSVKSNNKWMFSIGSIIPCCWNWRFACTVL